MKRYFTDIFKATIRYGIGTMYRYPTLSGIEPFYMEEGDKHGHLVNMYFLGHLRLWVTYCLWSCVVH